MLPASRNRISLACSAGALLLACSLSVAACGGGAPSAETPSLDKPVPATLAREDGAPAPIPVPGARAVVLDFWSPTCEPCKRTIPAMLGKRAEMQQKGAVHLLVAVLDPADSVEEARAVLSLWGINEPFVVDRGGAFMAKIGAREVPAFAVVDSAGILRWVAPDGVTTKDVLAAIP